MAAYGGYPWTVDDYLDLAATYPFTWWASLDYCVEQEIATDRDEVLDRMSRTVRAAIECRSRSEEHTSELQSLMRISYAVFCLKKKQEKSQMCIKQRIYTCTITDTLANCIS